MKIKLEIPDEFDTHEIKTTMLDAFYEFVSHRGPNSRAYVEKRYPTFSEGMRTKKAMQVDRRIIIANALHKATFQL